MVLLTKRRLSQVSFSLASKLFSWGRDTDLGSSITIHSLGFWTHIAQPSESRLSHLNPTWRTRLLVWRKRIWDASYLQMQIHREQLSEFYLRWQGGKGHQIVCCRDFNLCIATEPKNEIWFASLSPGHLASLGWFCETSLNGVEVNFSGGCRD